MALRERLVYAIDVVTDGVDTGLNRINKAMKEAEGATGKLKAGWSAAVSEFKNSREAQALAVGAASAVAVKAISDYSNLNESLNAVNVQYGAMAADVTRLGEDSAEAFGMSQRAFNEFAVGFSAFANQIAANNGQQIAAVVDDMAQRIADFASVNNLSLQEAEQVAKSTLAGETEAFRRFGGDVSAATVEAYAYQQGIADVGKELTEGQKTLARYGLFMDQTAKTQGDFANTSDGLANQQRILSAKVEDLSAKLGAKLYPAASDAAGAVIFLADAVDYLSDASGAATSILPDFTDGIVGFGERFLNPIKQIGHVSSGLSDLGDSADGATSSVNDLADADKRRYVGAERVLNAQEQANAATEQQRIYTEYAAAATQAHTDAMADAEQQAKDNVEAAQDLTVAYNDQKDAVDDLVQANIDLVGGELKVRDAQDDAKNARLELNDAIAEGGMTLAEFQGALDNTVEAQLEAAQAAADYRAKQLEANGSTVDAKTEAFLLRDELTKLAAQADGPLRAAIQAYIDQLNAIPTDVNTRLTVNGTPSRLPRFNDDGTVANYRAGTMYHPGGAASFNEPGNPEMAVFPDGSVFMPDMPAGSQVHRMTSGAMSAGQGVMGGGGGGLMVVNRGITHHHYHSYTVTGASDATARAAQRRVRGMM